MSYINVRNSAGKGCQVEHDAGDTVADLKKKIWHKLKIRSRHQILTHDGIELDNHKLVSSYNIASTASIIAFNASADFKARLDLSPQANINRAGNIFSFLASGRYETVLDTYVASNLRLRHNANGRGKAVSFYGEYFGPEGLLQWLNSMKGAYKITDAARTSSYAAASDFVFCEYQVQVKVLKTKKPCKIFRNIKLTFNSQGKLMLLDIMEDPSAYLASLQPVVFKGPNGKAYANKNELVAKGLTFEDQADQTLVHRPGSISGHPFFLRRLKNCTVVLADHTEEILINDLEGCKVFIGVSCGTVWARNCKNCQMTVVCQQLRVSASANCQFTVSSALGPILDKSHHIDIWQYKATYPLQARLFKAAGMNKSQNAWDAVHDQDENDSTVPYPHFTIKRCEGEAMALDPAWMQEHKVPVHAEVEARFQGKARYFRGRVSTANADATCNIVYVDGDTEKNVGREYIRVVCLPEE